MATKEERHAQILRAMAAEWRADDAMSEAMLDLANRVHAARNSGGNNDG